MIKILIFLLNVNFLFSCSFITYASNQGNLPVSNAIILPSWNEGGSKEKILDFIHRVTKKNSPDFVPIKDRIAVFDNDGTLWGEQPFYYQLFFVIDRVKVLSSKHPEWRKKEPFKSILANHLEELSKLDEKQLEELIMITHAGMTINEFHAIVKKWIGSSTHPILNKPYLDLVYQPMQEVLDLFIKNDFKVYIVSGGGVDFLRPWTEIAYGIPPEQVIGSTIATQYEIKNGQPELIRLPRMDFINDKEGKPIAIEKFIGKRPIVAFGNSDGDLQMLEWTTKNTGARLGVIIHHTDAKREYAYDRNSKIGRLDIALQQANTNHWVVVDMEKDWKQIYK